MLVLVLTPERDAEDRTKNRSGTKVDFSPGVKIVLQRNNKSDSRPRAEMVTPYSIQRYYLYFNSGSTEQFKRISFFTILVSTFKSIEHGNTVMPSYLF